MAKRNITIAVAGNPNSGKTTVFNALTGAYSLIAYSVEEVVSRNYAGSLLT